MKSIMLLIVVAIVFVSCGTTQDTKSMNPITLNDLQHHNFVLISVDGISPTTPGPNLEFGENRHISGAMCNRFMGQGELKDGVLTAKELASTRMLCSDEQLNQWDKLIGEVLQKGVKITLDKGQLVLTHGPHTLIYRQKDWVG